MNRLVTELEEKNVRLHSLTADIEKNAQIEQTNQIKIQRWWRTVCLNRLCPEKFTSPAFIRVRCTVLRKTKNRDTVLISRIICFPLEPLLPVLCWIAFHKILCRDSAKGRLSSSFSIVGVYVESHSERGKRMLLNPQKHWCVCFSGASNTWVHSCHWSGTSSWTPSIGWTLCRRRSWVRNATTAVFRPAEQRVLVSKTAPVCEMLKKLTAAFLIVVRCFNAVLPRSVSRARVPSASTPRVRVRPMSSVPPHLETPTDMPIKRPQTVICLCVNVSRFVLLHCHFIWRLNRFWLQANTFWSCDANPTWYLIQARSQVLRFWGGKIHF